MTDPKPKRLKKKPLVKVYGYMVTYYRCPYCNRTFTLEDAIRDRNNCHKKYKRAKLRKARKKF